MSHGIDATLLVLAKSPRPGRVKTRLCPPCTPVQAAEIAAAALADTLEAGNALGVRRRVLVIDGPTPTWVPESFAIRSQVGGGLGARLAAAFAAVDGPAFLVGMDTPQLGADDLAQALTRLASPAVDAVLGLATDGGWWGLGLSAPVPGVFAGVPMSSSHTGEVQLATMRRLGLRTALLPRHRDVDEFADARAVAAMVPGSRFATAVGAVRGREPAARAS